MFSATVVPVLESLRPVATDSLPALCKKLEASTTHAAILANFPSEVWHVCKLVVAKHLIIVLLVAVQSESLPQVILTF